ncbi:hypothetical protein [Dankookia sp. GCM10030260]|uniref:hypothetical protein n=1 Tax=Dankookia sp. GCM10030260 TaxID=3273390 RepID=UPI0036D32483
MGRFRPALPRRHAAWRDVAGIRHLDEAARAGAEDAEDADAVGLPRLVAAGVKWPPSAGASPSSAATAPAPAGFAVVATKPDFGLGAPLRHRP